MTTVYKSIIGNALDGFVLSASYTLYFQEVVFSEQLDVLVSEWMVSYLSLTDICISQSNYLEYNVLFLTFVLYWLDLLLI